MTHSLSLTSASHSKQAATFPKAQNEIVCIFHKSNITANYCNYHC
jgi:hypothetical protein